MLGALVPPPMMDHRSKTRPISRVIANVATEQDGDITTNPVARTTVSLEYASLRHNEHCPLGMYIVPSIENLLVWDAVFFVHQGECKTSLPLYQIVKVNRRILHRLDSQISPDIPPRLPRETPRRAIFNGCVSPAHITADWRVQSCSSISTMEVRTARG